MKGGIDMDMRKNFLNNLEFYMKREGVSRNDLAEGTKIPYTTICSYFNEFKFPRTDKLEKIAKFLHISTAELINSNTEGVADVESETDEIINNQYKKADLLKQLLSSASKLNISQLECLITMATTLSAQ